MANTPLESANPQPPGGSPVRDARHHILSYGWNSTCYQLLNHGIEQWWTADGTGLVGYVRTRKMAIVAGAPVCEPSRLNATVCEWEEYVASKGLQVCYFGAESLLQDHLANFPHYTSVVLGSQPEWEPSNFVRAIEEDRSLRAQLNRARNKQVIVTEWSTSDAENNPKLRAVLGEWLATRGLPKLHFLVEPETLGDLRDRRLFVACIGEAAIGFVTLCPVPARTGWLTEQFVRGKLAPNGTVELMLYHAALAVAADSASFFTMGIVPLIADVRGPEVNEPPWLRFSRRWAKAHYTRFYNFRGLSEFKSKFHPDRWQPVVVIVKDSRFKFNHLRAIGAAFTLSMPEIALIKGIAIAIRSEIRRLTSKPEKTRANSFP